MKYLRILKSIPTLLAALFLSVGMSVAANATTFKLAPIHMDNGYVVTGTIDTDGTIGFLTAANFVRWNIVATQTTDIVFTEKNSTALNISLVSTDGKKIYVPTSPDGATDGGAFYFSTGVPRGGIASAAIVADFTGINVAGVAGWQTPFSLNYLYLNEPNGSTYTAARVDRLKPNVFQITQALISTSPTIMKLFGTITTDGTIGNLNPANIKAWNITGREQDIQKYTEQTSHILSAVQVYCDGSTLKVYNGTGSLQIGTPGRRPIVVTLADFTDPSYPNGTASYYYGVFGLVAQKIPLTKDAAYVVAEK